MDLDLDTHVELTRETRCLHILWVPPRDYLHLQRDVAPDDWFTRDTVA